MFLPIPRSQSRRVVLGGPSGTARWQRGNEWTMQGPGALIFHDTGVRHTTITGHEPTLPLFAWVIDPASVPVIIRH